MRTTTRLVIAGGGTSGWLTAYSLAKRLGKLLDITLVESDQIGTVGVGEATVPTMRSFHQLIELDEVEFLQATQGTFKLAIRFDHWARPGDSYIHSFGIIGEPAWMAEFHNFWLACRAQGFGGELQDYCLEWKAAGQHKFARAVNGTAVNYAFHFNATAYAAWLRGKAEALAVRRVEGRIETVLLDQASGNIKALKLDNGSEITGDVFLDCTGFRALLLGQSLGVGYRDWTHWLPNDRALACQCELGGPPPPYTRAIAHGAGWQWRIPLQHRMGTGIVYSSQYLSDDEANHRLMNSLSGPQLTEPWPLRFTTGVRQQPWFRNCIAIGLASGFLEPLESTSIHLITTAITRLMRLFPFGDDTGQLARRYNEETLTEFEAVRDFIILHYKATERDDTPYWTRNRCMQIPDGLAHRLEIFRRNGYVWNDPVGLFRVESWVQVLTGQRLSPQDYHAAGCLLPAATLKQRMAQLRSKVQQDLQALPSHQQFIRRYCPMDLPGE